MANTNRTVTHHTAANRKKDKKQEQNSTPKFLTPPSAKQTDTRPVSTPQPATTPKPTASSVNHGTQSTVGNTVKSAKPITSVIGNQLRSSEAVKSVKAFNENGRKIETPKAFRSLFGSSTYADRQAKGYYGTNSDTDVLGNQYDLQWDDEYWSNNAESKALNQRMNEKRPEGAKDFFDYERNLTMDYAHRKAIGNIGDQEISLTTGKKSTDADGNEIDDTVQYRGAISAGQNAVDLDNDFIRTLDNNLYSGAYFATHNENGELLSDGESKLMEQVLAYQQLADENPSGWAHNRFQKNVETLLTYGKGLGYASFYDYADKRAAQDYEDALNAQAYIEDRNAKHKSAQERSAEFLRIGSVSKNRDMLSEDGEYEDLGRYILNSNEWAGSLDEVEDADVEYVLNGIANGTRDMTELDGTSSHATDLTEANDYVRKTEDAAYWANRRNQGVKEIGERAALADNADFGDVSAQTKYSVQLEGPNGFDENTGLPNLPSRSKAVLDPDGLADYRNALDDIDSGTANIDMIPQWDMGYSDIVSHAAYSRYMSDDERNTYAYILGTEGEDAAWDYYEDLEYYELGERRQKALIDKWMRENIVEGVNKNGEAVVKPGSFIGNLYRFLKTGAAVLAQPIAAIGALTEGTDSQGRKNEFSYFYDIANWRSAERQGMAESLAARVPFLGNKMPSALGEGSWANFMVQTAGSMIDNIVEDLAVGGAIGVTSSMGTVKALGMTGQAASDMIQAGVLSIMFSDVTVNTFTQNIQAGMNPDNALEDALCSGAIEMLSETVLSLDRSATVNAIFGGESMVKAMFIEGVEEVTAYGLGFVKDWFLGHENEAMEMYRQYLNSATSGDTSGQSYAVKQTIAYIVGHGLMDFAGGALATLGHGASGAYYAVRNRGLYNQTGGQIADNGAASVIQVLQDAIEMGDKKMIREAKKMAKRMGVDISAIDLEAARMSGKTDTKAETEETTETAETETEEPVETYDSAPAETEETDTGSYDMTEAEASTAEDVQEYEQNYLDAKDTLDQLQQALSQIADMGSEAYRNLAEQVEQQKAKVAEELEYLRMAVEYYQEARKRAGNSRSHAVETERANRSEADASRLAEEREAQKAHRDRMAAIEEKKTKLADLREKHGKARDNMMLAIEDNQRVRKEKGAERIEQVSEDREAEAAAAAEVKPNAEELPENEEKKEEPAVKKQYTDEEIENAKKALKDAEQKIKDFFSKKNNLTKLGRIYHTVLNQLGTQIGEESIPEAEEKIRNALGDEAAKSNVVVQSMAKLALGVANEEDIDILRTDMIRDEMSGGNNAFTAAVLDMITAQNNGTEFGTFTRTGEHSGYSAETAQRIATYQQLFDSAKVGRNQVMTRSEGNDAKKGQVTVVTDNGSVTVVPTGKFRATKDGLEAEVKNTKNGDVFYAPFGTEAGIDEDQAGVLNTIRTFAGNDATVAATIWNGYTAAGMSNTYGDMISTAYQFGRAGLTENQVVRMFDTNEQTSSAIRAVYAIGAESAKTRNTGDRVKSKVKGQKTGGRFSANINGQNYDLNTENGIERFAEENNLNANQKAALNVFKAFLGTKAMNVKLYRSTQTDANGNIKENNGTFAGESNTIGIDLNSGMDNTGVGFLDYGMARTFSHELTHYIQANSDEGYQKLTAAVMQTLHKNGYSVNQLIENRIKNVDERFADGTLKTDQDIRDEAVDEVVANACEMMLKDSKIAEDIARYVSMEDRSLAQKILDFIRGFINDLKKAFTGVGAKSSEAKAIASNISDMENIRDIWTKALADAMGIPAGPAGTNTQIGQEYTQEQAEEIINDDREEIREMPEDRQSKRTHNEKDLKPGLTRAAAIKMGIPAEEIEVRVNPKNGKKEAVYVSGRAVLEAVMRSQMKQNSMTEEQIKESLSFMDRASDFMENVAVARYHFIGLKDINDAKVLIDNRNGKKVVLSARVKNGEYDVNFDFTKICKKRIAFSTFIDDLASRQGRNGSETMLEEISLTPENIFEMNKILRDAGYETACLGCFVESRRYNIKNWADTIVNEWNAAVDQIDPNAGYFNFATGETTADELTIAQIKKIEDDIGRYSAKIKSENARLKEVNKDIIDQIKAEQKAKKAEVDATKGLSKDAKKARKAAIDAEYEEKLQEYKMNPTAKMPYLMQNDARLVKKLRVGDLISAKGRTALHAFSAELESIVASRFGTNSPKSVEAFAPYDNDIELLPATKSIGKGESKRTMSMQDYLSSIAGARSQSFSDFVITHVFDHLQKTAGLAARGFKAHTYTKEISRALLFGMTGEKINMSVMFQIDPNVEWMYAGLKGNSIDSDYFVADYKQAAETEAERRALDPNDNAKEFTFSIPFEKAVAIEHDPRYSKNCGIIGVGYSYFGMLKMSRDERVPYIIGYHRSGMPNVVLERTHIEMAADYTSVQNTLRCTGFQHVKNATEFGEIPSYATWKQKAKKTEAWHGKEINLETLLADNNNDPQAAMKALLDFMQKNELTMKTAKAEAGHGSFDLYGVLESTQDPKATADEYIRYCLENGEIPMFYEFAAEDNYYKHLFDFSVTDLATGECATQQPVSMNGLLEMGADKWIGLVDEEMNRYNRYMQDQYFGPKYEETIDRIYDKIKDDGESVRKSSRDTEYMNAVENGDMETAQRMVDEAAIDAGYVSAKEFNGYSGKMYHGSNVTDITEFNTEGSRTKSSKYQLLFGTHLTLDPDFAEMYTHKAKGSKGTGRTSSNITGRVYELYAKLGNTLDLIGTVGEEGSEAWRIWESLPEKDRKWWNRKYNMPVMEGKRYVNGHAIEDVLDHMGPEAAQKWLNENGYNSVRYNATYIDNGRQVGDISYIVLDPSQLKSADPVTYDDNGDVIPLSERFNEQTGDIRFSGRDEVEIGDKLIAVHNLSEEQLLQSLRKGGFPAPSVGIVKRKYGNKGFGNISVLFRKDTVDPMSDSRNRVYGDDAYTMSYPNEEQQQDMRDMGMDPDDIDSVTAYMYMIDDDMYRGREYMQKEPLRVLSEFNTKRYEYLESAGYDRGRLENKLTRPSFDTIRDIFDEARELNSDKSREEMNVALNDLLKNYSIISSYNSREDVEDGAINWDPDDISSYMMMEHGVSVTKEWCEKLSKELDRMYNNSVYYFEAKPYRTVHLDEVASIIVPSTISDELRTALEESGVPYREYEGPTDDYWGPTISQRQVDAVNAAADEFDEDGSIMFSKRNGEVTDSDLLRMAGEAVAQTDTEREYMQMYQKNAHEMQSINRHINETYEAMDKAKKAGDEKEVTANRHRLDIYHGQLERAMEKAVKLEESKPLQGVMDRIRTETEAAVMDALQEVRNMDTASDGDIGEALQKQAHRYQLEIVTLKDRIKRAEAEAAKARSELKNGTDKSRRGKAPATKDLIDSYQKRIKQLETRIASMDNGSAKALAKEVQKRDNAIANLKDRRKASETRQKIRRIIDDFNKKLAHPRKGQYIPAEMVRGIIDALEQFDLSYVRGGEEIVSKKIREMHEVYERYKKDGEYTYHNAFISAKLEQLADTIGDTKFRNMKAEQLQLVYEVMKSLHKVVTEAVNFKALEGYQDAIEAGDEAIYQIKDAEPMVKGKAGEILNWMSSPDNFFKRISGFAKDAVLTKMQRVFVQGEQKMLEIQREYVNLFSDLTNTDAFKALNQHSEKDLVDVGLTSMEANEDGEHEPVMITRGMMLALYMHLSCEDNIRGIARGGIKVPNLKRYYEKNPSASFDDMKAVRTAGVRTDTDANRIDISKLQGQEFNQAAIELTRSLQEAEDAEVARLTELRKHIYDMMTEDELKMIGKAHEWYDDISRSELNDVSMDMYGFKVAAVENYFPIHRDPNFLATQFQSISNDAILANIGLLKERVKASQPILLTDFAYEIAGSVDSTSRYVGFARAERDFNLLYRAQLPGMSTSLREQIGKKFGSGDVKMGVTGMQYIENYVNNIIGNNRNKATIWDDIRSNLARSTLTLNPRVALSQAASIPTAVAELDLASVAAALKDVGIAFDRKAKDQLAQDDIWFWQRYRGQGGMTEFADAKKNGTKLDRIYNRINDTWFGQHFMNWCQDFDVGSTAIIHKATEYWVTKNTGYTQGTEAWKQAVADKYRDVLRRTQPMYMTTARSDLMRSNDAIMKTFTMFKTQASQNLNTLYNASAEFRKFKQDLANGLNGVTEADVREAKNRFQNSIAGVAMGAVAYAFFRFLVNAMMGKLKKYKDDETDEVTLMSSIKGMGLEALKSLSSMVVFGDAVWDAADSTINKTKYYGLNETAVGQISGLADSTIKMLQSVGTDKFSSNADYFMSDLAGVCGIPWDNMKNAVSAGSMYFNGLTTGMYESSLTRTDDTMYNRMISALLDGNMSTYESVMKEEMRSSGKSKKETQAGLKNRIGDWYESGALTREEATKLLTGDQLDLEADDVFWFLDKVDYKIGNGGKSEGYDKTSRLQDAIMTGSSTEIESAIGFYRQTGYAGKTENAVKAATKALYEADRIDWSTAEQVLITYGGYTDKKGRAETDNLYWTQQEWEWYKEGNATLSDSTYSKYIDLDKAIDDVDFNAAAEQIAYLMEHGVTKKSIAGELSKQFKDTYLEMLDVDPESAEKYLTTVMLPMYKLAGYSESSERAYIKKNWL